MENGVAVVRVVMTRMHTPFRCPRSCQWATSVSESSPSPFQVGPVLRPCKRVWGIQFSVRFSSPDGISSGRDLFGCRATCSLSLPLFGEFSLSTITGRHPFLQGRSCFPGYPQILGLDGRLSPVPCHPWPPRRPASAAPPVGFILGAIVPCSCLLCSGRVQRPAVGWPCRILTQLRTSNCGPPLSAALLRKTLLSVLRTIYGPASSSCTGVRIRSRLTRFSRLSSRLNAVQTSP